MTKFSEGNLFAAKPHWRWTEDQIRAYHAQIRPVVDLIGVDRLARITGYQRSYVRLMCGLYDTLQQPSEAWVNAFDRAVFLFFIRDTVIPWLRAREGQARPFGDTWTRARARKAKSRCGKKRKGARNA